jgi:hypothetical protein
VILRDLAGGAVEKLIREHRWHRGAARGRLIGLMASVMEQRTGSREMFCL